MKYERNLWVLGGDLRQVYLARLLAQDGHHVHTFALDSQLLTVPGLTVETSPEQLSLAEGVIFPMPMSNESSTLFAHLT